MKHSKQRVNFGNVGNTFMTFVKDGRRDRITVGLTVGLVGQWGGRWLKAN